MPLQASNFVVEVRDRDFQRLGQIDSKFLDLKTVEVFRGVGAWELKLPAEHPLLAHLREKGAGIIVSERVPGGGTNTVFSGRMREAVLSQDAADPKGTWLITGVDDNVIAAATAVLPDPANPADSQTTDYWNLAGSGETVMKQAVSLNIGPSAIAARKYPWLAVAASLSRGGTVSASARFNKLGDLLTSLSISSGLGWRFTQQGSLIQFDIFEPTDKSSYIRLDIRNGGLASTELGYSAPTATSALVMGQGQGAERTVRVVTSTEAAAEAALWGLRWEVPKDQRNTDDPTELQQAGEEILAEQGTTIHSLKITPADSPNQRLGVDWGLGDIITVIIDGQPATATVAEIATSVSSAGVIRTATVGDPVGYDWEAKVSARIREQDTRISDLERLVDTGVTWDGVSGKPTQFTPAPHGLDKIILTELGGGEDLNSFTTTALLHQAQNADAASGSNYPTPYAGLLEVYSDGSNLTYQRYTAYNNRGTFTRARYQTTWSAWSRDGMPPLPDGVLLNGPSAKTIGSTAWTDIDNTVKYNFPAQPADLLVDLRFSALGITSTGYWMIGVRTASSALNIDSDKPDPNLYPDLAASSMYALYAPFSQTTQQLQLIGVKRVRIPAGTTATFAMQARKSVSGATASMNYINMEIMPVRWA